MKSWRAVVRWRLLVSRISRKMNADENREQTVKIYNGMAEHAIPYYPNSAKALLVLHARTSFEFSAQARDCADLASHCSFGHREKDN